MTHHLTFTQIEVLRYAVADSGTVTLTRIDARAHFTKRHRTAAIALARAGLGRYSHDQTVYLPAEFKVNEAGRQALANVPAKVILKMGALKIS